MIDAPMDKRFEAYFRKDAESEVLEQVKTLPTNVKELGLFILDRDKNAKKIKPHTSKSYQANLKRQKALYIAFDKLLKKDKLTLIQCFCSSLSNEILLAYEFEKQLPELEYFHARLAHRTDNKSIDAIEGAGRWLNRFCTNLWFLSPIILRLSGLSLTL